MKARSSDPAKTTSRRQALTLFAVGLTGGILLTNVQPAHADALDDARSAGAVGERYDGFAVARDPSASGLVDSTNAKRMDFYKKKASEQGVAVEEIQAIYAQAIRERAQSGWWFETRSGWQQK